MMATPAKFVLVSGTGWTNSARRRVARMLGTTLAEAGFGLVTGSFQRHCFLKDTFAKKRAHAIHRHDIRESTQHGLELGVESMS